jgi:hypothetical protein
MRGLLLSFQGRRSEFLFINETASFVGHHTTRFHRSLLFRLGSELTVSLPRNGSGQFNCGIRFYGLRNFSAAAKYFKLAADQNHARGQFNYGICLYNGDGVPNDLEGAAKYFKLAADQNHAE